MWSTVLETKMWHTSSTHIHINKNKIGLYKPGRVVFSLRSRDVERQSLELSDQPS